MHILTHNGYVSQMFLHIDLHPFTYRLFCLFQSYIKRTAPLKRGIYPVIYNQYLEVLHRLVLPATHLIPQLLILNNQKNTSNITTLVSDDQQLTWSSLPLPINLFIYAHIKFLSCSVSASFFSCFTQQTGGTTISLVLPN